MLGVVYALLMPVPLTELLYGFPQVGWALGLGHVEGLTPAFVVGALIVLVGCWYGEVIFRPGAVWLRAAVTTSCIFTAFLLMAVLALALEMCGAWLDWFYEISHPPWPYIDLFGRDPRYGLFWGVVLALFAVLMCISHACFCRAGRPRWIRYAVMVQLCCAMACGGAALLIGHLRLTSGQWQYSGAACALTVAGVLTGALWSSATFCLLRRGRWPWGSAATGSIAPSASRRS
jgi:hypothetical protein